MEESNELISIIVAGEKGSKELMDLFHAAQQVRHKLPCRTIVYIYTSFRDLHYMNIIHTPTLLFNGEVICAGEVLSSADLYTHINLYLRKRERKRYRDKMIALERLKK